MDVRDSNTIEQAAKRIMETKTHLVAIFNNAGVYPQGKTTAELMQLAFDVNAVGVINIYES